MPRAMRWNEIYGTFRSGQLSPAQQDNIRDEIWRNGAALVENFRIERDGGLSPRPNFKRQADVIATLPTLDLLSAAAGGPYHTHNTAAVPIHPRGADHEYVARVGTGSEEFRASLANSVIFELDFVRDGNAVHAELDKLRAITFHGVRRIEGHTSYGAGDRTLNTFAVWMEWGDTAGNQDDANWVQYPEPRPVPSPAWNGVPETGDADLLGLGAFSPGQVARDITIPVPAATKGKFIRKIEIRITRAAPTAIVVEGLSCYGYGEGAPLALKRPYRLIPWPIRGRPFVLLVELSGVKRVQLEPFKAPLENRVEPWPFTPRQLREMTWCRDGANLLLCHHDFPHPLEVVEGEDNDIIIRAAALRNVPVVTRDMFRVLLPNVIRRGDDILTSPVRPTGQADVPYSPRLLTLVMLTAISATLQWASASGNSYDLTFARWDRDTSAWIPEPTLAAVDVMGGEHVVSGLRPDTTYRVQIRAKVGTVMDRPSQWFTFATDRSLAQVANVTTEAGDLDGVIDVSWDEVTGADAYAVFWRDTGRDPQFLPSRVIPATPGLDGASPKLEFPGTAGRSYAFRVEARAAAKLRDGDILIHWSDASVGDLSDPTDAFEALNLTPAQVTNVTLEAGDTDGALVVRWSPVLNADSYIVKVNNVDQSPVTISPYTIDGGPGTLDTVTVRARREHTASDGPESAPAARQATRVAGGGVTGLTLERGDDATDIDASWNADERASSYDLQWRKRGAVQWTRATVTGTSHTIPGDENTTYEVRVRAIVPHSAVSEPWSAVALHTTGAAQPATPTGLAVRTTTTQDSGAANGSMVVSWNGSRNAQGYIVEKVEVGGGTDTITISQGGTTTITTTGTVGKTYRFRVRSTRAGASPSAWSSSVSHVSSNIEQPVMRSFQASGSQATVAMAWNAPRGGASSYNIRYREVGTTAWTIRSRTALNYSFLGTLGALYEVQGQAVGTLPDGTVVASSWTPTIQVRLLGPPTSLSATFSFRRGGTTFRWAAPLYADFYEYELESPLGRSVTPRPVRITGTEFFSSAVGTGTYKIRVRAGTDNSFSAWTTKTGTI